MEPLRTAGVPALPFAKFGGGVEKLCEGEMGAGSDTLLIVRLGLEELTNSYRASS